MDRTPSPLDAAARMIIFFCMAAVPLLVLPVSADPVNQSKLVFLGIAAALVLVLWTVRLVTRGEAGFNIHPAAVSVLVPAAFLWIHAFAFSRNVTDAFFLPGGPVALTALAVICVLAPSFGFGKTDGWRWLFIAEAAVMSLLTVYQALGVTRSIGFLGILAQPGTTPVGSVSLAAVMAAMALPLAVERLIRSRRDRHETATVISWVALAVLSVGIAAGMWIALREPSTFLPLWTGWDIMLETWKNAKALLVGVGLERYAMAFMNYRPAAMNTTPQWNMIFGRGATTVLDTAVTTGLAGLAALGFMLYRQYGALADRRRHDLGWVSWASYGAFLFAVVAVPPQTGVLLILALLMFALDAPRTRIYRARIAGRILLPVIAVTLTAGGMYGLYRWYGAEIVGYRSTRAANAGNSVQAYGYAVQAIELMPTSYQYRITASQLSLDMGLGILTQLVTEGSGSATYAQEKETAGNLVNQAVREANAATTLSPDNAYAWANVATIYQNLVGIAQNADQYAESAYRKAIQLDPQNPLLRLNLGTLYVKLDQYDAATTQYLAAMALKPDYANAQFNLANALMRKGDYENALSALEQTKKMIANDPESTQKIEQMELEIAKQQKKN